MLSKYVKFTPVTMARMEFAEAPYNPRTIDAFTAKKLREHLKSRGLIEPIVVNKRTMRIVGGHQRIAALDALHKGKDYEVPVALIDVSEKAEREHNVALNNPSLQGQWDQAALAALIGDATIKLDIDAMGFEPIEIESLLGGLGVTEGNLFGAENATPEQEAAADGVRAVIEAANAAKAAERAAAKPRTAEERAEDVASQKERIGEKIGGDDSEFHVTVLFRSRAEREAFMRYIELHPDDKYMDGSRLWHKLGVTDEAVAAMVSPSA